MEQMELMLHWAQVGVPNSVSILDKNFSNF